MKKTLIAIASAAMLSLTACNTAQVEASATFIAAEAATAGLIQKNPAVVPVAQLIVTDWAKFQGGKLTSTDEASLLQAIVTATKANLTPVEAATLDGAVQTILSNTNSLQPTALSGAANAIITDLVNGIARELV